MTAKEPARNTKYGSIVDNGTDPESAPLLSSTQTEGENDINYADDNQNGRELGNESLCYHRAWKLIAAFYKTNSFLVMILAAILLAYANPRVARNYLAPQFTSDWLAIITIFVLAGLSLQTSEFSRAIRRVRFNLLLQSFNFGGVSLLMFGFTHLFRSFPLGAKLLPQSLADAMVLCSCLPVAINVVIVLTRLSSGDEAAAVFNVAFGNLFGVFFSPLLILLYLNATTNVNVAEAFTKMALKVLLPVVVGQILQHLFPEWSRFKPVFKHVQEGSLVFIVYTAFCSTFLQKESDCNIGNVILMVFLECFMLCFVLALAWQVLKYTFPDEPRLRVMGLFGCTNKTIAMGIPLIKAMYSTDPRAGLYTLPLLVWHPMQLLIGTMIAPSLAKFVEREEKRLGREGVNEVPDLAYLEKEENSVSFS